MQMKGLHSVCALAPYVQAGAGTKPHKENRKPTLKKIEKKRRKNMQCYSVSKTLFRVFFFFFKGKGGLFVYFFLKK